MPLPTVLAEGLSSIRRFADYRGRSTRTELGSYWLVSMIGSAAVLLAAALADSLLGAPGRSDQIAITCFQTIVSIPLLALWVRRVHDSGRSGLWLLLVVPLLIAGIVKQYALLTWDFDLLFHSVLPTLNLAAGVLALPAVVFLFVAGDDGPNRYGPNPRDAPAGEPA